MDDDNGMMKMYFHFGCDEVILFDFWRTSSVIGMAGSAVACFVLAVLYEALKFYRESRVADLFIREQRRLQSRRRRESEAETTEELEEEAEMAVEASPAPLPTTVTTAETKMMSSGHLALTALQLLQVTFAYALMLIVMTFNAWLCLATVAGAAFGYFLFGWRKTLLLHNEEPCH